MKTYLLKYRHCLMLMAAMLFTTISAFADVPSAPQNLGIPGQGKDISNGIFLAWNMPDNSSSFQGFAFYLAEGRTHQTSEFLLIDTLGGFSDENANDIEHFFYTLTGIEAGEYTVYITAYNSDGESLASNFLDVTVVNLGVESNIYFTNKHLENLKLAKNSQWTFNLKADSKDDINIKYKLGDAPAGVELDENTGMISWTPTEAGSYSILSHAYEVGNEDNQSSFWIDLYVYNCDSPPVFNGTLSNEQGEMVKQGKVYLYSVVADPVHGSKQFWSKIEDGKVSIEADADEYRLVVYANGHKPFYLPNEDDKGTLKLTCSEEVNMSFELEKNEWNQQHIRFTSNPIYPDQKAAIGENWNFDFDAEAIEANIEIRYAIQDAPEDMIIDPLTGIVSWTPVEKGFFRYTVEAFDKNDQTKKAVIGSYIEVFTCTQPIIVAGNVNYEPEENGDELVPVSNGSFAVLIGVDENGTAGGSIQYSSEIKDGHYSIEADAGTYVLYFSGCGAFTDEYWSDATKIQDAQVLELECGKSYSYNVLVERHEFPKMLKVSGRVTDEDTGEGIPYAFVEVLMNTNQTFRLNSIQRADENGYYEATLNDHYEYVLRASSEAFMPNAEQDSVSVDYYLPEYYSNVTDILEATLITLTEDIENMDFALTKSIDYKNSLAGSIVDSDGNILRYSFVSALLIEKQSDSKEYVKMAFTAQTDKNGDFSFNNLMPGDYILLAYPLYQTLATGYYVDSGFATMSWKDATRINIQSGAEISGKVIKLQKMIRVIGNGSVAGRISKNSSNGGIVKGSGKPVSGAIVYAINEDGELVECQRTDNSGGFRVENLEVGSYNIRIDKVGFDQLSLWAEIKDNNKHIDIETISLNGPTTSVSDQEVFAEVSLYPNPAVTHLTVNLGTLTSDANINLVDLTGVTLYKGTVLSNENYKIDIEGMSAGMYYLKVTIGEKVTVLPVSISK